MAKLTLNPITSAYQAVTALNANNALIEAALENTLSRDGTTPNTMSANLDLNSNKILNSALAAAGTDLPTYQQVQDLLAAAGSAAIATPIAATLVTITDTGGFYTSIDVENALQEIFTGNAIPSASTQADSLLIGDGSGGWTEATALTVDSVGNLDTANFIRMAGGQLRIRSAAFDTAIYFQNVAGSAGLNIFGDGNGHVETIALGGGGTWTWGTPLRIEDNFDFLETVSATTPPATYGRLWVRNDAPNTLMFTDDTGNIHVVAGSGADLIETPPAVYRAVKEVPTARANTIALADDPDLALTGLEPGFYILEGFINWTQSGTGGGNGPQLRLNIASGTVTGGAGSLIEADQTASPDGSADLIVLDPGGGTRARTNSDTDLHRGHYRGYMEVTTTAAMALQWAQNTSHADSVSILGGYFQATRMS